MRIFVGLPLPEIYQEELAALRRRWERRLRSRTAWTRPGNWHLTLKFLGEVDESRLGEIRQALGAVKFSAYEAQAGAGGFFPGPHRPRVLWVGMAKGAEQTMEIARAVEQAMTGLDFEPEERPFAAHLTLARIKEPRHDPWEELLGELAGKVWPAFTMNEFVLWKSELSSAGPKYTPLGRFSAKD